MATYNPSSKPEPIEIEKFLGLNESVGETEMALGESVTQENLRVTSDYKLQNRPGMSTFVDYGTENSVQGIWQGLIDGVETLVVVSDKSAYAYNDEGTETEITDATGESTVTDREYVEFVASDSEDYDYCMRLEKDITGSGNYLTPGSYDISYDIEALDKYAGGRLYWTGETDGDTSITAYVKLRSEPSYTEIANGGALPIDIDTDITGEILDIRFVLATTNTTKTPILYEYGFNIYTTSYTTKIGAFTVDAPTSMFWFEGKLYFLNGTDYKEYDGTTFQDVDPYVPTLFIACEPTGGGTPYENVNLLTGTKKQEFIGDGAETTYQLAEDDIDANDVVITIDSVTKTEDTHFSVNRTNGTVDFSGGSSPHGAPASDADVIITWTKVVSGHADKIKNCKYAIDFGPGNDTAVFIWGNPNEKNYRRWSGTLRANYFPTTHFTRIGSDGTAITDIVPQYDRQIIFKENRTYYSYAEYISATETYDYPVYDLNEKVGHKAPGQGQLIKNSPVTLTGSAIWRWTNTDTEDERNAEIISTRIQRSLEDLDLTTAVTFDYQKQKEYWVNVGDEIYIWNYGNDTFYKYTDIEGTCFLEAYGYVYAGVDGALEEMSRDYYNDNGEAIYKKVELGFTDFGVGHLRKNTRKLWISFLPHDRTSVNVYWQTNKKALTASNADRFYYALFSFSSVDFSDFSFDINRSPEPFRMRLRAKKYAYIKFILENNEADEQLTILALKVLANTTSEVR